jgi:DNA-binding NarL/FixJ family response regulator
VNNLCNTWKRGKDLPTVIFLDLNMPRKNGFACLDDIKCNDHLKHIAVIIFSTFYDKKIADQLYEKGAHYYICKPASFSQLKMTIGHALSLISKGQFTRPPKENFVLCNLTHFP